MHTPKQYCAITTRTPFAAVLARRHFTGAIIVGGAWQNERSMQAVLDDLKARLKKEFSQHWLNAGIVALLEDSEAGRALAEMAERTVPIGWTNVYRPIEALRQDLETTLRIEGPATAKLQIDEHGPGARELAQALDAQTEGGRYDALALCLSQIREDEVGGSQDIKVLSSWDYERNMPSK